MVMNKNINRAKHDTVILVIRIIQFSEYKVYRR